MPQWLLFYRVKGKTYVGHAGAYPGNTTQTLIQLDDKVGVIVLTNTNDSFPADIAQQLMASVGEAVAKAAMTKPLTLAWDPAWERFAGALSWPLGRSANRIAKQETGRHYAECAEPR